VSENCGRINVKILKNRLGGYVDRTFPMMVNYNTLKITDWSGEIEDDIETIETDNKYDITTVEKTEIDQLFDED
jgi:hypothetical protein